jgi:hypothetical protein
MSKKIKDYENSLNKLFSPEEVLEKTEHCWSGNDKTKFEKKKSKNLALQGKYGTVLRRYDPIAFQVGFNDWKQS